MSRKLSYCRKCFTIYLAGGVAAKACACPAEQTYKLITHEQLREMFREMERAQARHMAEMVLNRPNILGQLVQRDGHEVGGFNGNYYIQDVAARRQENQGREQVVNDDRRNPWLE